MKSPRDIISEIRSLWGADSLGDLDPKSQATVKHLRSQLGNSLELLSDQLYQSEDHYFLELLQNSDDNEYDDNVLPSLEVQVERDRVVFRNNERGFSESNVQALCGIGSSTKKGRKKSQIGEKGIGFKAVFQVSNTPEIHSAGFHFRFNRLEHKELGLVIPEWIEKPTTEWAGRETCIVLPLMPGFELKRDLISKVEPELLLFLRRLRRLSVTDAPTGREITLTRKDTGSVVCIERVQRGGKKLESSTHHFFVHKQTVSMEGVHERLRPDITESEVVVALPTQEDGSADVSQGRSVFAFLPVTESGMRFVCHADFVVSTNRESIQREKVWNTRLRDALGLAFAEAMIGAQSEPKLGRTCLAFLAEPKTIVDPFLRPVMETAIANCKQVTCVPTDGEKYTTPSGSIRHDREGLSSLVDADALTQLLKRQYIDDKVQGIAGALQLLGVDTFKLKHLIQCIHDQTWVKSQPLQWFANLLGLVGGLPLSETDQNALRKCAILRLANGDIVSAMTRSLFRSVDSRTQYGFEEDFRVLDPAVLKAIPKGQSEGVTRLMAQWRIQDAAVQAIIDDYILPNHTSDDWKNKTTEALRGHVRYVRDHLKEYLRLKGDGNREGAIKTLGSNLYIQTTETSDKQDWFSHCEDLYLGKAYRDPLGVERVLGASIENLRISTAYMDDDKDLERKRSRELWVSFFEDLGAHCRPRVIGSGTDWQLAEEVACVVSDSDWAKREHFLRILDREWAGHYSNFATTFGGGESSFVEAVGEMAVQTLRNAMHGANECYLLCEENLAVFGDTVPYLAGDWSSLDFLTAIGVTTTPAVEDALARLTELGDGSLTEKALTAAVQRLYRFLDSRFEGHEEDIQNAFQKEQVVYLKGKGGWCTLNECCWSAPDDVREFSPVRALGHIWSEFREFFCDKLELVKEPTPDDFVTVLEELAKGEAESAVSRRASTVAYRALSRAIDGDEDAEWKDAEWFQRLSDGHLLRTTKDEWWHNDGDVVVPDDPRLQELFCESDKVGFLDVDLKELPYLSALIEAMGLPYLSEARTVHAPNPRNSVIDEALGRRIKERWRYITRFVFYKYNKAYQKCAEDGRLAALKATQVIVHSPLSLRIELCEEEARARFDAWSELRPRKLRLYVDRDHQRDWDAVARELVCILGLEDTVAANLERLLRADKDAQVEAFLRGLHVSDLPDDERRRWGELAVTRRQSEGDNDGVEDEDSQIDLSLLTEQSSDEPSRFFVEEEVESEESSEPEMANTVTGETEAIGSRQENDRSDDNEGSEEVEGDVAAAVTEDAGDGSVEGYAGDEVELQSKGSANAVDEDNETSGGTDAKGLGRDPSGRATGQRPAGLNPSTTAPTRPDSASKRRSDGARGRGRLISYVGAEECESSDDWNRESRSPHRGIVAQGAVDCACDAEKREGRSVAVMAHNHPGYDLEARGTNGEIERFIEVKGIDGEWDECGVVLSHTQFKFAEKHRGRFWLYVVEFATDVARRRLHRFQNVFEKATSYGFDHGWKAAADDCVDGQQPSQDGFVVGARIRVEDGRLGSIKSINDAGLLTSVTVRLDDGMTVNWTRPRTTLRTAVIKEPSNGPDAAGSQ